MAIYFYSTIDKYGALSNFSPHGVKLNGDWWPTVEHFFQAQKFEDESHREKIRVARSPKDAKSLGQSRKVPIRADWEEIKDDVMLEAVRCKAVTHGEISELLTASGEEELIENAPGDYYWGCGKDGSGQNKLGQILMQVRTELHKK